MIKVYVSNLKAYNAGLLIGKWIELPLAENDLKYAVKQVLGHDVEYFVADYDAPYGMHLGQYDDVFALNEQLIKFQEVIQQYDARVIIAAFRYLVEIEDVYSCLKDGHLTLFNDVHSTFDLGYAVVKEGFFMYEIPEELKGYMDYEVIGEEWECSGTVIYDDLGIAVRFY